MMSDRGDRKKFQKTFGILGKAITFAAAKNKRRSERDWEKWESRRKGKKLKKLLENQKSFLTLPARLKPVPEKADRGSGSARK